MNFFKLSAKVMVATSRRTPWKGAISFGLVHIPIALHPATSEQALKILGELKSKLEAIMSSVNPFVEKTGIGKAHWVKPTLLAEVSFGEWTQTGRIRHAVFHGLRTDKKAKAIIREIPLHLRFGIEPLRHP